MIKAKIVHNLLLFYVALLSAFVAAGSVVQAFQSGNPIFFLLFVPVVTHFALAILRPNQGHKLLLYYNFILTSIMGASGFIGAKSFPEIISAALFLPLVVYFWLLVFPKKSRKFDLGVVALVRSLESEDLKPTLTSQDEIPKEQPGKEFDSDRRTFLKLVGSASLTVLLLSLFTKKVEDTFFGGRFSPSPASTGVQSNNSSDRAKQPTDGYKISEIDDSTPSYFGFIETTGKWFIMQETETGSFRYTKGDNDFTSNWTNRDTLKYEYYDAVF